MNLNDKYLRFKEYLENGGLEKIYFVDLLEDLKKVRFDSIGNVIPESITSLVMAAFNAIAGEHQSEPYLSDTFIEDYQSFNQKDLYFSQQKIESESEFNAAYEKFKNSENILFRGVSEAKWRLLNSLQRFWIEQKYFEKGVNYQDFLLQLIENAKSTQNGSVVKYLQELNLDSNNDIAILSFLQHHGSESNTPLLDWSYKFSHSLFFAIDKLDENKPTKTEIEQYFSVYYLDDRFFKESDISKIVKAAIDEKVEDIFQNSIDSYDDVPPEKLRNLKDAMTENAKKLFAYQKEGKGAVRHITKIQNLLNFPFAFFSDRKLFRPFRYSLLNNFNIINQQGAFIWNYSPTKPLEYVAKEEYLKENNDKFFFCYCLNINKNLKHHIRKKLEEDGITNSYIYPNSNNIANESFNKTRNKYYP